MSEADQFRQYAHEALLWAAQSKLRKKSSSWYASWTESPAALPWRLYRGECAPVGRPESE
jgi:hypothetical protein